MSNVSACYAPAPGEHGGLASHPLIIQGGMGAGVSAWPLAKSVSSAGLLGVVSGTALDVIMTRRLQAGDPDGHVRRALDHFQFPEMARRVIEKYFIDGGKNEDAHFSTVPMCTMNLSRPHLELIVAANFVEVFLAKEGHNGVVGINYLEKIQLTQLASIYGAILAGVDYVIVGAGIPREIPGILDSFAENRKASLRLNVAGAEKEDDFRITFDPLKFSGNARLKLMKRPFFFAITSSTVLAQTLVKKGSGKVDGLVIEGPLAGGHNALPRGVLKLDTFGEPLYGPKDDVDLESIKAHGVPFWLAGAYGTPAGLKKSLALGASGIQAGTVFAFCNESGLTREIKESIIRKIMAGSASVFTDPKASPTGFPFKILRLEGTNSEDDVFTLRKRVCDLGYLRHLYRKADGKAGYRCPAEPVDEYVKKGGAAEETAGCKCLCNGLLANIGLSQRRADGSLERPLLTAGKELSIIPDILNETGGRPYSATDVIEHMLKGAGPKRQV